MVQRYSPGSFTQLLESYSRVSWLPKSSEEQRAVERNVGTMTSSLLPLFSLEILILDGEAPPWTGCVVPPQLILCKHPLRCRGVSPEPF